MSYILGCLLTCIRKVFVFAILLDLTHQINTPYHKNKQTHKFSTDTIGKITLPVSSIIKEKYTVENTIMYQLCNFVYLVFSFKLQNAISSLNEILYDVRLYAKLLY